MSNTIDSKDIITVITGKICKAPTYGFLSKVFLVGLNDLEKVLRESQIGRLNVVAIDSQEVADKYSLEYLTPTFPKIKFEDGNLYVLDTRSMEKPQEFFNMFLPQRYYSCRHDTSSRVVALKEHNDFSRFCHMDKFSGVIEDCSGNKEMLRY